MKTPAGFTPLVTHGLLFAHAGKGTDADRACPGVLHLLGSCYEPASPRAGGRYSLLGVSYFRCPECVRVVEVKGPALRLASYPPDRCTFLKPRRPRP